MKPTDPKAYAKAVAAVKARVARWPSAYASAQVVAEYKRAMGKRRAFVGATAPLARWFAEKWVDVRTGKPCGAARTDRYYPTCRPTVRVTKATPVTAGELTRAQKAQMVAEKQRVGPATARYAFTQP